MVEPLLPERAGQEKTAFQLERGRLMCAQEISLFRDKTSKCFVNDEVAGRAGGRSSSLGKAGAMGGLW